MSMSAVVTRQARRTSLATPRAVEARATPLKPEKAAGTQYDGSLAARPAGASTVPPAPKAAYAVHTLSAVQGHKFMRNNGRNSKNIQGFPLVPEDQLQDHAAAHADSHAERCARKRNRRRGCAVPRKRRVPSVRVRLVCPSQELLLSAVVTLTITPVTHDASSAWIGHKCSAGSKECDTAPVYVGTLETNEAGDGAGSTTHADEAATATAAAIIAADGAGSEAPGGAPESVPQFAGVFVFHPRHVWWYNHAMKKNLGSKRELHQLQFAVFQGVDCVFTSRGPMFELANKKREQSSRKRQASATAKVARALATLAGAPNPAPATASLRRQRSARASSRSRSRARDDHVVAGTPVAAHTHGGGGGGAVLHSSAAPCAPLAMHADPSGAGLPPAPAGRLLPVAGLVCSASSASSASTAWGEGSACVPDAPTGGDSSTTPLSTAMPTPAAAVTGPRPHTSLDDAGCAVEVDASTVRSVVRHGRATVEPMDHVQGVESGKFRCRHCRVLVRCDGATLLRAVVAHLVACPRLPPFVKTQIKATPSPRSGSGSTGNGRGGRSKRNSNSSSSVASRAVSLPRPGQALGRVANLMLDTSFAANLAPAVRIASPATGQMALAGLLALGAGGAVGAAGAASYDTGEGTGAVVARDTKRQRIS